MAVALANFAHYSPLRLRPSMPLSFSPYLVAITLLIASIANISSLLWPNSGGDIFIHYNLIRCFADQFWQGDLYPRWCFDANAGLGSPAFLFHFPLPYYIATLLYPLTWIGLPIARLYHLLMLLASLSAGYGAWHWLKGSVRPGIALIGALLYLWVPYRMEVMVFHASYTELWLMSLLPLLLIAARRLIRRGAQAIPFLAVSLALCILCYLPGMLAVGIGLGIYVLVAADRKATSLLHLAASALLAAGLVAFFVLPALHYHTFIQTPAPSAHKFLFDYAHRHPHLDDFTTGLRTKVLLNAALTVLALCALATILRRGRARVRDRFALREAAAWLTAAAAGLFLFLPVSEPLYGFLGPLRQIAYPWRMQTLFLPALPFAAALCMQWLASDKQRKTWKMDLSLLLAVLVMLSYFVTAEWIPDRLPLMHAQQTGKIINASNSLWIDEERANQLHSLSRLQEGNKPPAMVIVKGKGDVTLPRFGWDGIAVRADLATGAVVRLDHRYFPVWHVSTEPPVDAALAPEAGSGLMLLTLPAGSYTATIYRNVYESPSLPVRFAPWISLLSLLAAVLLWRAGRRRASNAEPQPD